MSIKVDTLLKRSISFERLALYIDQRSFLQAIAQVENFPSASNKGINAPYVDGTFPQNNNTNPLENSNDHEEISSPIIQVPEKTIVGYTPIPEDVQKMLSHIVTTEGGKPIAIDGEMGPETRNAINAFKKIYNVPGNFGDREVFDVIRNTYNRSHE
jgi:hypothetical protein